MARTSWALDRFETDLSSSSAAFVDLIDGLSQAVLAYDDEGRIIACNEAFRELFAIPRGMLAAGSGVERLWSPTGDDQPRSIAVTAKLRVLVETPADACSSAASVTIRDGDHEVRQVSRQRLARHGYALIAAKTRPEQLDGPAQVEFLHHDSLTGLLNRESFLRRLAATLEKCSQSVLLCIDLDGFKMVNDTLGHPFGDELLRLVGDRLRGALRDEDLACRLGGDEFAVILGELDGERGTQVAGRLVDLLSRTYLIDGQMVDISASIGLAVAPEDAPDVEGLLKFGDLALYAAKRAGRRTYRRFVSDMAIQMADRRAFELELRTALARREFELLYQPQLDLDTNQVRSFEALIRWRHPERGLLPPGEFIALAEQTGLIVPMGEWVLHTACRHAVRWPDEMSVAVNLSPAQFKKRDLPQQVAKVLAATGLSPHRLELEITETLLFENSALHMQMLGELRDLGVRIAMDDFGTGYSSLSTLQQFPFDRIKIDRSFMRNIEEDRRSAALVQAIAAMGIGLGIKTTAEGVETENQRLQAQSRGCNDIQGYLIGKPMPLRDVEAMLETSRTTKLLERDQ